jgi:asparagine synthase (glutamine-hydrolysing)
MNTVKRAADAVKRQRVSGDFLEMGVALGGSAIVLAAALDGDRQFHGYDVFEMIPAPSERDPRTVHERYAEIAEGRSTGIGGDQYYGYVGNLYDRVVESFSRYGMPVDGKRINLHRGLFDDTLHPARPIALAHVDCDWHDAVALCLERIWPHVSMGGWIIVDDYLDYGGCRQAVESFLAATPTARLAQREPNAVIVRSGVRHA